MSHSGRRKTHSSQIHVSLRHAESAEHKDEPRLQISGRPPTHLGTQGDHASAYHLIENVAHTLIADSTLAEAMRRAFHLFNCLQEKVKQACRYFR